LPGSEEEESEHSKDLKSETPENGNESKKNETSSTIKGSNESGTKEADGSENENANQKALKEESATETTAETVEPPLSKANPLFTGIAPTGLSPGMFGEIAPVGAVVSGVQDNISWSFNDESKVLTISGSGDRKSVV
jgi:hypothetical protein